MIKFSKIESYLNKEGSWMPGSSVSGVVVYPSLQALHREYPVQEVEHKHAGTSLAPYLCNGRGELAKWQDAADKAIAAGRDIRWDVTGEQDKAYRLYKDEKLVWQCHLNRFEKPRRLDLNIATYGSMILDFDEYGEEEGTLRAHIDAALAATGWAAVVQSSFNNGVAREGRGVKQAYHVFLELDAVIKKSDWLPLFASVEAEFAKHGARVDGVTSDYSRLYFGVCKNATNGGAHWVWDYVDGGLVVTAPLIAEGVSVVSNKQFKAKERKKFLAEKNGLVLGEENPLSKIKWDAFDAESVFDHLGIACGETKMGGPGAGHEWTFRYTCTEPHGGADDAVCAFTPGRVPMIYCAHDTCAIGKGEGSTKRFFTRHWGSLPAEVVDEGVVVLKRKARIAMPEPLISGETPDVEVVVEGADAKFETELDLGQKKAGDILEVFKTAVKNIMVIAPTGAGKTTANIAYAVKCLNKGERVLYVCSTKAEMGQFEDTMKKKASEDIRALVVYHSSETPNVPKTAMMVVTHHHYMLRAGMMDMYYPVVDWAEGAVVIIDEVDALMAQMAKIIPVTARTTKFKDGYTHYQSQCPSRTAHRYQCDNCVQCTRMPMQAFANRIWTIDMPKYGVSDYDIGNPSACRPVEYAGFSNVVAVRNVFESAVHELKLSTLARPDTHMTTRVLDPDSKASYLSAHSWINTIIAESDDPTLVQTNDDLGFVFQEAFAEHKSKYVPESKESEEDIEKNSVAYANAQIGKKQRDGSLRHYPMHACGTKELHYVDTFVLKLVIRRAERVRYTTGTMSERKKKVLTDIHGDSNQVVYTEITNTSYVPIDNLTLVLVEETLTNSEIADIHIGRKVGATDTSHGMKLGKALIITPTASQRTTLGAKATRAALYDHESRRAAVAEGYQGGKWETLITYSRSPLGRGMDLGDFGSCLIDAAIYKPMYSYDFSAAVDLDQVQQEERNSYIAQNSGRILRRPMHIVEGNWEVVGTDEAAWANDRCIVIHGVENMASAKKTLVRAWQSLVAAPINVIIINERENLLSGYNSRRVSHVLQQHWAHVKIPGALALEIPEELLDMDYRRACRRCPKLKDFLSEGDHSDVYEERKALEKFKEHTSKFSNLETGEKKRSVHWSRISSKMSIRVMEMYEIWFSKK